MTKWKYGDTVRHINGWQGTVTRVRYASERLRWLEVVNGRGETFMFGAVAVDRYLYINNREDKRINNNA